MKRVWLSVVTDFIILHFISALYVAPSPLPPDRFYMHVSDYADVFSYFSTSLFLITAGIICGTVSTVSKNAFSSNCPDSVLHWTSAGVAVFWLWFIPFINKSRGSHYRSLTVAPLSNLYKLQPSNKKKWHNRHEGRIYGIAELLLHTATALPLCV